MIPKAEILDYGGCHESLYDLYDQQPSRSTKASRRRTRTNQHTKKNCDRRGPVVQGPNLGLSMVDLNDGSYSTTKIYPVSGIPGNKNEKKSVGDFYVQFTGDLCAYHVPGGSFAMRFTGSDVIFVPDGVGGQFLEGTFELEILEATGIYGSLVGGHNHMVDRLHFLAPGDGSGGVDEYCFCFVSRP